MTLKVFTPKPKKSALIVRHGAYGDMIHVSHLPRLLKDNGYDLVGFSTGKRGMNILKYNPFIDKFHFAEISETTRAQGIRYFNDRVTYIGRDYDDIFNLNQLIEVGALAGQQQREFYLDQETRNRMGGDNYYDIATKAIGFKQLCGNYRGELFFSESEEHVVARTMLKYSNKFNVLVNLAGSSPHKAFIQANEVIELIMDKYEDVNVFTTGDEKAKDLGSKREGVIHLAGKLPFRQVMLMAKYMNCVIGCESGMVVASSCFGVPTIQLLTAASKRNHVHYAENDYSLQSPARCSPCHKNPYDYWGCPTKDNYPLCVHFDTNLILEKVEEIHVLFGCESARNPKSTA